MAQKKQKTKVHWWEGDPLTVALISFGFLWGGAQILAFILSEVAR